MDSVKASTRSSVSPLKRPPQVFWLMTILGFPWCAGLPRLMLWAPRRSSNVHRRRDAAKASNTPTQTKRSHNSRVSLNSSPCTSGPIQYQPSQTATIASTSQTLNETSRRRPTAHSIVADSRPGSRASRPATTTGCQPRKPPAIISRLVSPQPRASVPVPALNSSRTSPMRIAPAATPARPVASPSRQLPDGSQSGRGPQTGHGYKPAHGVTSPIHQGPSTGIDPT